MTINPNINQDVYNELRSYFGRTLTKREKRILENLSFINQRALCDRVIDNGLPEMPDMNPRPETRYINLEDEQDPLNPGGPEHIPGTIYLYKGEEVSRYHLWSVSEYHRTMPGMAEKMGVPYLPANATPEQCVAHMREHFPGFMTEHFANILENIRKRDNRK